MLCSLVAEFVLNFVLVSSTLVGNVSDILSLVDFSTVLVILTSIGSGVRCLFGNGGTQAGVGCAAAAVVGVVGAGSGAPIADAADAAVNVVEDVDPAAGALFVVALIVAGVVILYLARNVTLEPALRQQIREREEFLREVREFFNADAEDRRERRIDTILNSFERAREIESSNARCLARIGVDDTFTSAGSDVLSNAAREALVAQSAAAESSVLAVIGRVVNELFAAIGGVVAETPFVVVAVFTSVFALCYLAEFNRTRYNTRSLVRTAVIVFGVTAVSISTAAVVGGVAFVLYGFSTANVLANLSVFALVAYGIAGFVLGCVISLAAYGLFAEAVTRRQRR